MKTIDVHANLIKTYLELLGNLSTEVKLEIISKLLTSMKLEIRKKEKKGKKSILDFYGAIESDMPAEEMIEMIRKDRSFNRQIEPL